MKKPQLLLLLVLIGTLTLSACDQFTTPPPLDPNPPGQPDPGEPGDVFDVLEVAWELEIPQGDATTLVRPALHVNDDGIMYFAGQYFPGHDECEPGAPPETCHHARGWTITPDGEIRGAYDARIPGTSASAIRLHSTLPAPNGDAFLVGHFGGTTSQGFMQRINADAEPVGSPILIPTLRHLTATPSGSMLYDVGFTHDHTFVRGTSVDPTTGTSSLEWNTRVSDYRVPRYLAYNDGEVHAIVSEMQLAPNERPNEFIALDAYTGQILHKTELPKSAPTEPGNTVYETPATLVVNTAGETIMYTFSMEKTPDGATTYPSHIVEIIYNPDTREFTHNTIEFLDPNMFYVNHLTRHMYPVAMPSGEVLLTVATSMGFTLTAIKDSEIQWIHDIHPGRTDPPNYEPLGITFHPETGYYVLGTLNDEGLHPREARYHLMRFTGMKGAPPAK